MSEDEPASELFEQRDRVSEALEAFAENTLRHLREETGALSRACSCRSSGRVSATATRSSSHGAPETRRDLSIVAPTSADFKPVLVGVDGGADALIEAGYKPDVIVGDMDSVSDKALQSGAELVVHAYPGGRVRPCSASTVSASLDGPPGPGALGGRGDAPRLREGRRAHRRGRHALQPDRVPRAQPGRHVLDVPHPAEGGGEAGRRPRRVPPVPTANRTGAIAAFTLAGVAALSAVFIASPDLREFISLLGDRVRLLLGVE